MSGTHPDTGSLVSLAHGCGHTVQFTRAARGADKAAITAARLFDVFERDGERSMAVEVTLQPGDKAFVDAELKAIADKVVAAAAKLGATLRG